LSLNIPRDLGTVQRCPSANWCYRFT
jgi:hypothetical protein